MSNKGKHFNFKDIEARRERARIQGLKNVGIKRTPEQIENMKKIAKSIPSYGKWNMGKIRTKEVREKIANSLRGKTGELSRNWKGGISSIHNKIRNSDEYKIWRKAVFERDRFTCIWCGYSGNKLNADHIKPFSLFPELRFAIDNGRTLCEDCHRTTDTYGGSGHK